MVVWWAHQDLNLEPTDYESAALTVELWAREVQSSTFTGHSAGSQDYWEACHQKRTTMPVDIRATL